MCLLSTNTLRRKYNGLSLVMDLTHVEDPIEKTGSEPNLSKPVDLVLRNSPAGFER